MFILVRSNVITLTFSIRGEQFLFTLLIQILELMQLFRNYLISSVIIILFLISFVMDNRFPGTWKISSFLIWNWNSGRKDDSNNTTKNYLRAFNAVKKALKNITPDKGSKSQSTQRFSEIFHLEIPNEKFGRNIRRRASLKA